MNSVFFLALRRLRAPLILLIVIYAVSVLGLVLIPGVDAEGKPAHISFFHAFYFMSYTATTIGFGEIPYTFSDAQRFWVIVCIYLSVIGWSYAILALLTLFQDRSFRLALTTQRFELQVQRLTEPFYIICGYGETGSLVCRALDHLGARFVVLDSDETRIDELNLQDFSADVPALLADVSSPETLLLAGLKNRHCQGVIALVNNDAVNLAIAIAVRLLNPAIPIICRAERQEVAANMASFGTDHIINPFEKFAQYLALAIHSPGSYRLLAWLTGMPGATLRPETEPPRGRWIICGYGRLGREVIRCLDQEDLGMTLITTGPEFPSDREYVIGQGTEAGTLLQARIEDAVALVAGTDNDANNLSIAMTARELNPYLFLVLRQNSQRNRLLFDAIQADLTMVPPEIITHECLAVLTTPLLLRFLAIVKRQEDAWADALIERLQTAVGSEVPDIWTVDLSVAVAPGLKQALLAGDKGLQLDCLLRNSSNRDEWLPCVPLLLVRKDRDLLLPQADAPLLHQDQILFAGTPEAHARQNLTLQNVNISDYVRFGKDIPGGWVWQWLRRRAVDTGAS